MHIISAEQHFIATFKAPGSRFAKPGEAQDKAIKRYMGARKRAWSSDRTTDSFPRWTPQMTTREYVRRFQELNHLIDEGHVHAAPMTIPTMPTGADVIVEIESELV
jgi:hypothetical protein